MISQKTSIKQAAMFNIDADGNWHSTKGAKMKTQSKHTPGPWKCVALEPDNSTNWARFQIQHWPDEEHRQEREAIADVLYAFGERKVFEHAGANARLIAAAPELLEALQELVGWDVENIETDPQFYKLQVTNARKIIAKAEGK